jgi:hypothetical protein
MRTDGRTDMTKLIVAFRNLANAPKKGKILRVRSDGLQTCKRREIYPKGLM